MSQKKFQVFVSSTYEDLQAERQEVMRALLELECIPAGMELFPAANEDQWTLIKDVIKDCDYYIVIVGGRYGSIGLEGLSYTEMEYRYAVELGKPIIAFLHKDPDSLQKKRTEASPEGQAKLKEFRDLCQKRVCKYWTGPEDLGSVVSRGLIMLQRKHPGVGWIRGDAVASEQASKQILELREEIDRLNRALQQSTTKPPPGTENLSQGDEKYSFEVNFTASDAKFATYTCKEWVVCSWNSIFSVISPLMIHEASEPTLKSALNDYFEQAASVQAKKNKSFKDLTRFRSFLLTDEDFQTIKVQFRALGLITQSSRNRSVKDTETYWTLTPFGDNVMVRLRAIEKEPVEDEDASS